MKVIQICKRINNDESGKSNNHDHFINLPSNLDFNKMIFDNNKTGQFIDKRDDEIIELDLFENRNWIKRLKPYYEKYDLYPGDEIILERRIHNDGKEEFFIDHLKHENNIVFQMKSFYDDKKDKKFKCFEKLKGDHHLFNEQYSDLIIINSLGRFKRNKSKKTKNNKKEKEYFYECFEIVQNDENLLNKFKVNDLIEIKVVNNKVNVTLINKGIICEMEV